MGGMGENLLQPTSPKRQAPVPHEIMETKEVAQTQHSAVSHTLLPLQYNKVLTDVSTTCLLDKR